MILKKHSKRFWRPKFTVTKLNKMSRYEKDLIHSKLFCKQLGISLYVV